MSDKESLVAALQVVMEQCDEEDVTGEQVYARMYSCVEGFNRAHGVCFDPVKNVMEFIDNDILDSAEPVDDEEE